GTRPLAELKSDVKSDLLRIVADLEPGKAKVVGLSVRGVPIEFDVDRQRLTCRQASAPVKMTNGRLRLDVFVDRGSIEIFAAGGAAAISVGAILADDQRSIALISRGGEAIVPSVTIWELKSAW